MSDTSQGPGWWIASDGKWYSPDQKPGPVAPEPPAAAPVTPPPVAPTTPPVAAEAPTEPIPVTSPPIVPPAAATPPPMSTPPPMATPPGPPPGTPPPTAPPPAGGYGFAAPPPIATTAAAPAGKKGNGCLKAAIIVAVVVAVLGIGTVVALVFLVNKGVDSVNSKLDAQRKVEQRTGISSSSFNTEHPPQDDLAGDWKCSTTASGYPQVTGTVKNNSSHTSSYAIAVEFKQNGSQFSTGSGLVVSVDPGQTADFSATGSVQPEGQFSCKIDSIDRSDIGTTAGN